MNSNLDATRLLPITKVAARLGIKVLGGNKAMCFVGHDRKTPSLSFNVRKNYWHCFGCGLGGGPVDLVKSCLGCDFKGALRWFADQFGVYLTWHRGNFGSASKTHPQRRQPVRPSKVQTDSNERCEFAPDPEIYGWLVSRCGPVTQLLGLDYLRNHGISHVVANAFGVRELRSPERAFRILIERWGKERVHRCGLVGGRTRKLIWASYAVLFPFRRGGDVIYLQGRLFEGGRKYINLKGIRIPLYNVDRIGSLPLGTRIHICEGVPDALAMESKGLPAVAVLGASSFREEWVDDLLPYQVAVTPDSDDAGSALLRKVKETFRSRGKSVALVSMPRGKKDVADVVAEMEKTL